MIESYYWRQELKSDVAWLRQHATFRRWTEKQMVLFERRLILTAFQIRVLIEQKRVRSSISARSLQCTWHRKVGSGPEVWEKCVALVKKTKREVSQHEQ